MEVQYRQVAGAGCPAQTRDILNYPEGTGAKLVKDVNRYRGGIYQP